MVCITKLFEQSKEIRLKINENSLTLPSFTKLQTKIWPQSFLTLISETANIRYTSNL